MGNKLINSILIVASCSAILLSCKDLGSNDAQVRQMEDSVFKRYPTVNGVSIEVKEHQDVIVTLRDKELYSSPQAEQQRITNEIAQLTIQLFEKNNYLDEGTVIFAENENGIEAQPDKEKKYDMQLEKLLSVGK
ncbi:hypothetical protein [Polluticoccus soli]|uniref:hypothetical protein n=1 Tax=Polluticoccus soli TaxID=3034150 RepID=UPI0023E15A45|nr:hypothetical protein [Flavipsychrobacter sp. JY13-12]